mgnify:CR=1 FL=1
MAVKDIVTGEKNARLRRKSRPVTAIDKKLIRLLDDMRETMREHDGIGIAAPQVGVLRRVVVVDAGEDVLELINPVLLLEEGRQTEEEGCLSLPDRRGIVARPQKAVVSAYDRRGNLIEYTGEGMLARVFSHEIDHLDGVLFVDKMIREVFAEKK